MMSDDEVLVMVLSTLLALGGWTFWLVRARQIVRWPANRPSIGPLAAALVIATAVIVLVVRTLADAVVREMPAYQFLYVALGAAWLKFVEFGFHWFGLSVRDDVVERANPAATAAIGGLLIGIACAYAGGNIGDGPGWWIVVFSAAVSTTALAVVWNWLGRFTRIIDAITIDRDMAAGVRFGGFMIACGLIAGRAVAGDWTGLDRFFIDFASVAPWMLVLLAAAVAIERVAQPTGERPHPPVPVFGIAPAVVYLAATAALLAQLGLPQ